MLHTSFKEYKQEGLSDAEAVQKAEERARDPNELAKLPADNSGIMRTETTGQNTRTAGGASTMEEAEANLAWDHKQGFTTDAEYATELENLHLAYAANIKANQPEDKALANAEASVRQATLGITE